MRRALGLLVLALCAGCGPTIDERFVGTWHGAIVPPVDTRKEQAREFAEAMKQDGALSLTLEKDASFRMSVDGLSGDWQLAGTTLALVGKKRSAAHKPVLGIEPVLRILPVSDKEMKWEAVPGVTVVWRRG